jgi:hypothetical protein
MKPETTGTKSYRSSEKSDRHDLNQANRNFIEIIETEQALEKSPPLIRRLVALLVALAQKTSSCVNSFHPARDTNHQVRGRQLD